MGEANGHLLVADQVPWEDASSRCNSLGGYLAHLKNVQQISSVTKGLLDSKYSMYHLLYKLLEKFVNVITVCKFGFQLGITELNTYKHVRQMK